LRFSGWIGREIRCPAGIPVLACVTDDRPPGGPLRRRLAAAVSVTLLVIAVGMGSAACGAPVASGASRLAQPATVYVANCDSDTVTVIGGDSRAGPPVKVGHRPCAIAITADGRTALVVGDDPGTVTAISTATSTAGKPVS